MGRRVDAHASTACAPLDDEADEARIESPAALSVLDGRRGKLRLGAQMAAPAECCPVCLEVTREDGDDALTCANGHRTCLWCVGQMVKPCGACKPGCTGLWFTCPLCCIPATLKPGFVLAVLQGSWERAHKLHASDKHLVEWETKCETTRHA